MITVLDVRTPVFERISYETSLLESICIKECFLPIIVTDKDSGANSVLVYSIINGNEEGGGIFRDSFVYVRQKLVTTISQHRKPNFQKLDRSPHIRVHIKL